MDRKAFIQTSCKFCIALTTTSLLSSLLSGCSTANIYKATAIDNDIRVPVNSFLADETYKIIRTGSNDFDILLRKRPDGNYSALLMKCTHVENALVATKKGFSCNMHGSQFNEEGDVVQGPAARSLTRYQTSHDNEYITIHLSKTS